MLSKGKFFSPANRISCRCGAGKEHLSIHNLADSRRVPYGAKHRSALMRNAGTESDHVSSEARP